MAAAFNPNVRHLRSSCGKIREENRSLGPIILLPSQSIARKRLLKYMRQQNILRHQFTSELCHLTSSQNAEFLHNEVPGIKLTDEVRARMALSAGNREQSTREGLEVSKELIDVALEYFHGIYLITPFMRYDMTVNLTEYINDKVNAE